ncbi:MAG: hypothetical protein WBW48_03480 [Anaerolineae bacterium]
MILLDSDVMIDLLRQYPPATSWFDTLDDEEELPSLKRGPKARAGGLKRLPLLLFGLGIVLVVDLQGLLLYNNEQQGMFHGFPQRTLSGDIIPKNSVYLAGLSHS